MSLGRRIPSPSWPALAGLLLAAALAPPPARAADAPVLDPTASCVAVMQTYADELAGQVRAGNKAQEPALRTELERAAVLIGRSYLGGEHDEDKAKARLKQAQDAQASWPEAQRASHRQACVAKADAELAKATGAQRYVVKRIAQARLQRLLATP